MLCAGLVYSDSFRYSKAALNKGGIIAFHVCAALLGSLPAMADGRCLKSERAIKLGAQAENVREYVCRGAKTAPSVKVAFYKLSEVIAATLADNGDMSWVSPLIGNARIVETPVLKQLKELIDAFGIREEQFESSLMIGLDVPGKANANEPRPIAGHSEQARQVTYFSTPWTVTPLGQSFPLPHYRALFQRSTAFPNEFSQRYERGCEGRGREAIKCLVLWKYLSRNEVERFREYWQQENREAGQSQDPSEPDQWATKYMQLVLRLTRSSWPEDFLVADSEMMDNLLGGCGAFSFTFLPRRAILDVAVVENISSNDIEVSQLLGSEVREPDLRKTASFQPAHSYGVIFASAGSIPPGGRILVPLRIVWVTSHGLGSPGDRAHAEKLYRSIQALPEETILSIGDRTKRVRKARNSFLPPTWPSTQGYTYGHEMRIDGLVVNGERMMLEGSSANFVEITVSPEGGSCPYLYAFSGDTGLWRYHRKVIHSAQGRAQQTTDFIDVEPGARRFRLVERELEVSHIDKVSLTVTLKTGESLTLHPDIDALKEQDDRLVGIYAGDTLEFGFTLPDNIGASDVRRARLAVTGYYERYGTLNLSGR